MYFTVYILSVYLTAAAAAEVYFYDAVENVEELALIYADDEDDTVRQSTDPRLSRLQLKLVNICQRKANVRNRKVSVNCCRDN